MTGIRRPEPEHPFCPRGIPGATIQPNHWPYEGNPSEQRRKRTDQRPDETAKDGFNCHMLSKDEKENIKRAIDKKAHDLDVRIEEYKELTKPIPPSDAIGRVSRMDAINNKSVNEAALRQAENLRQGLHRAMSRLNDDRFGLCNGCGKPIPTNRLLLMPGAVSCVRCAG